MRAGPVQRWGLALVMLLTGALLLRTQQFHHSLTPWDKHLFSCSTSIMIENIPWQAKDGQLPQPAHPAKRITPDHLLNATETQIKQDYNGRIIHQSWKTRDISDSPYAAWEPEVRWSAYHTADRGWHYVLWSDADNRRFVEQRYPEFLQLYDSFPREIYRADFVRPLFMHAFGGIYADLDLNPLSDLGTHLLFEVRAQPLAAYIGKMWVGGTQPSLIRFALPNAFMAASAPGHPFWLHYARDIEHHWTVGDINRASTETATGPAALHRAVGTWKDRPDEAVLQILPEGRIYPFSWDSHTAGERCVCLAGRDPEFSPERCQALHPEAWTITYWQSGWM